MSLSPIFVFVPRVGFMVFLSIVAFFVVGAFVFLFVGGVGKRVGVIVNVGEAVRVVGLGGDPLIVLMNTGDLWA